MKKWRPSLSVLVLFCLSAFAFFSLKSMCRNSWQFGVRESRSTATSEAKSNPCRNESAPRVIHLTNVSLYEYAAVDPAAAAIVKAGEELLSNKKFPTAQKEHLDVALDGISEWLRLQVFDPTVMAELLDLVKRRIDGKRQPYGSCAVVGNSGILLTKRHGKLIDGHELVIRLNNAPADRRYAAHVGGKTGLSFINSNVLSRCTGRRSCYCHAYGESVPIVMYICQARHFLDHAICNATSRASPVVVTDPRFDMLCARLVKYYSLRRFVEATGRRPEEWDECHDVGMFHYSSGMQAVLLAAGICEKVSIFGFGKAAEARHHYHTMQRAELPLHDYEAEYEFYGDLADRPGEIPYLKDSGFRLPPVRYYR